MPCPRPHAPTHAHALTLGALALGLLGCGTPTAALGPVLEVSPSRIDFGRLEPEDEPVSQPLTLENSGDAPLSGLSVEIDDFGFGIFALARATAPAELAAGARLELTVTASPGALGDLRGRITIESAALAPTEIPLSVVVQVGPGPDLALRPSELDFGEVALGEEWFALAWIDSVGEEPLEVMPVWIEGDPGFSVTMDASPTTLPVGDSAQFQLRFAPDSPGEARAELFIQTDGNRSISRPDSPGLVILPLRGVGTGG